jgi:hypothetical protein
MITGLSIWNLASGHVLCLLAFVILLSAAYSVRLKFDVICCDGEGKATSRNNTSLTSVTT